MPGSNELARIANSAGDIRGLGNGIAVASPLTEGRVFGIGDIGVD